MTTVVIPPGTPFGCLTVIEEARTPAGRRAMLCQCKCGRQKIILLASLRSGRSKSCGCFSHKAADLAQLKPGEIPLYGKRARGRVVFVDIGDYDLVMQYRWNVTEHDPTAPGRRSHGPYAVFSRRPGGRKGPRETVWMHQLITGWTRVDHKDGNGLNNRRSNLRPATKSQNGANARKNPGKTSRYKGVFWERRRSLWQARIMVDGETRQLGRFANEEDAARAYDDAARAAWGEFALPNFPEPSPEMQADWEARRQAERAGFAAGRGRKISASKQEWWKARPFVTHVCTICGNEFQSNWVRVVLYCGRKCNQAAQRQRKRERELEGRLF